MNTHSPQLEGNICSEQSKAVTLAIWQYYYRHTVYVDKSDHITNSYSINRQSWAWEKSSSSIL